MKIGISADYRKLTSLMETFKLYNIGHVQIGGLPADIESGYSEILASINSLRTDNPNIELSLHAYPFNLAEGVEPVRKVWLGLAEKTIALTARIGAKFVNFHMGYGIDAAKRTQHTEYINGMIPVIGGLAQYGAENGVEIHIENLYPEQRCSDFCKLGDRVSDFKTIFSAIDRSSLKLCYDYGHGNLDEHGIDILRSFPGRLGSIHAHDNDQIADIHWPIGSEDFNTIDWEGELAFLEGIGFSGPFILESYTEDQMKSLEYLLTLCRSGRDTPCR